jgi:hypothetical protein
MLLGQPTMDEWIHTRISELGDFGTLLPEQLIPLLADRLKEQVGAASKPTRHPKR